jgi:hypothetical protein
VTSGSGRDQEIRLRELLLRNGLRWCSGQIPMTTFYVSVAGFNNKG